jgi:aspartokinase
MWKVFPAIALVALVGEGITKKEGIAAKAFQAVAEENINIEIIAAGASTAAVYFVVKESDCDRAVKATHQYFFPEYPGTVRLNIQISPQLYFKKIKNNGKQ